MNSERPGNSLSRFIGKEVSRVRSTATQFVDSLPERWRNTLKYLSKSTGLIGAATLIAGIAFNSEVAMAFGLGGIAYWVVNSWSRKYDTPSRQSFSK